MKFSRKHIFIILLASVVIVSCHTQKKTEKNKNKAIVKTTNELYENYSKKLDIKLNGNENTKVLKSVTEWLGIPYKYGGCTKSGIDCSCFVKNVYKDAYNTDIDRSAADMINDFYKVNSKDLQTGDLVFFKINSNKVSHVGIYISNNKFAHASSSKGVIISDLSEDYYKKYFFMAGRLKTNK